MKRKLILYSGIFLLIFGFFSLTASLGSITGFATLGADREDCGSSLGIIFIVGGVVLILVGREDYVLLYHAHPLNSYKTSEKLDSKNIRHDSFFLTENKSEAISALQELRPELDEQTISIIEIRIQRAVLQEIGIKNNSKSCFIIPTKNFDRFNESVRQGKIIIQKL